MALDTIFFGKCYQMMQKNIPRLKGLFKKEPLILHLHEPGDEMWLAGGIIQNNMVPIEIQLSEEILSIEMILTQRQTTYMSTKVNPCDNSHSAKTEYIKCIQVNICKKAKAAINCSLPGSKLLFGQSCNFSECSNSLDASISNTFFQLEVYFNQMQEMRKKCIHPCFEKSFGITTRKNHVNSVRGNESEEVGETFKSLALFDIYFSTDLIEDRTEALMIDGTSFWSSVGGNLGLFLGFSVLSVGISVIKIGRKSLRKIGSKLHLSLTKINIVSLF